MRNKQQVADLLTKEKENTHALDEPGRFSNKRDPFDSSSGDDDNFDGMEESTASLNRKAAEGKGRRCKKYKTDVLLPLGIRKDDESPRNSKSISKNLPQKPGDHLSGVEEEKVNHTENTQVEESSEKCLHLKPAIERKHHLRKKAVPRGDLRTCNSDVSLPLGLRKDDESPWDSESISETLPQKPVDHLSGAADEKGNQTGNTQVEDVSLPLGLRKDDESPWDSESISETLPQKPVDHLSGAADEKGNQTGNTQVEEIPEEVQERLDGCENIQEQVSVSHEDLWHKYHRLQDENARLRLEINAIKNQSRGKEKKYLEYIEIAQEKTDYLQRTIKLNEERIFQHNGQLNSLTVEKTMSNSKQSAKQIKERLETETESHRTRLAAAVQDYRERQPSKRDVELAFQRARDEWAPLQEKLNFDLSNLKNTNEMLSQQLSQAERKFNSLEVELHHTRDALREKTSALEQTQRAQNQALKKIKHIYQKEQIKVNTCMQKQESLEERLSQLQREDALLQKHLDDADTKVDDKEKPAINIQDQFQEELKKQYSMLEDKHNELLKENNHLKERLCQCEKEKAEKVAVMYLQQGLADTLKEPSLSKASRENSSHYHMKLEDENQDLKKKLNQIRKQLEDEQSAHIEALRNAEKMRERLQMLELENSRLKCKVNTQPGKTEQLQKNPLRANLSEGDKEQLNTPTESMEYLKYTLDEEKKKNEQLQNELTRYKQLLKMTKAKLNEQENGDFCLRGDFKSNELDIPLNTLMPKARAASQENLEQLRETNNASMRSQMELRIKDLESELNKMKIQENSTKVQLARYKQRHQEAVYTINRLISKLSRAYDKLEVVQNKRLLDKQRHRTLLSTLSTRPVLQYPCGSNLDHSLAFQSRFLPQPSNNSVLSNPTERQQELENTIVTEVREVIAELEMVIRNIQDLLKNQAKI